MSENPIQKQRLLIVDDSKVIRVTARKILQNYFETIEAVDGNNAWEILAAGPAFSLVVSDLTMPHLDGFGLLEKIRSSHDPEIRELPVIIITGANDSESTMQRARTLGATDFIGKPFDSVHLLARTQAHADTYTTQLSLNSHTIELEDQARIDNLTGLQNDTAFMERGDEQRSYAKRHQTPLSVAQLEIDHFNELFSTAGQDAANSVLNSLAGILLSCARKEDVIARTGAARFSILLPGMSHNDLQTLAERIMQEVRQGNAAPDISVNPFSVSIGLASMQGQSASSFEELLRSAGTSLRDAIDVGGNRIIIASTATEPVPPPAQEPDEPVTFHEAEALDQTESTPSVQSRSGLELEPIETAPEELASYDMEMEVEVEIDAEIDETPAVAVFHAEPAHDVFATQFDQDQETEDEEIVITAPYSLFDDETPQSGEATQWQPATEPEAATGTSLTPESRLAADENQPHQKPVELVNRAMLQAALEEEEETTRGLFGKFRSLFRRSARR